MPEGVSVAPGDLVLVTLSGRPEPGIVWDSVGDGTIPDQRLRPIVRRYDLPPVPAVHRRFLSWVSAYTLTPMGLLVAATLRARGGLDPPAATLGWRPTAAAPPPGFRLTPARARVLAALAGGATLPAGVLARTAGVSPGVIGGLAEAGLLVAASLPPAPLPRPDPARAGPTLSDGQAHAAESLRAAVTAGGFSSVLLDGVTGSGKTEVFLEAVAACLAAGRQALVLLPEIALSLATVTRFADRFGAPPALWHSDVPDLERRRVWRGALTGEATLVVGARSALFLPFRSLGLIVVDEEHEAAYKQEEGILYHARDMAVVRARLGEIPIVLASATPSLETIVNAETGRYRRLVLPARHGGASLPAIAAIDLRRDKPPRGRFLAPPVEQAVAETLARGEQALLFLNRRGYAPLTLCRACGHRLGCPNCSAWLVEHRLTGRLQCHHCGHAEPLPSACPACATRDSFAACGPGVERVAEEAAALWPDARTLVLASDLLPGPEALQAELARIRDGQVDLIIGTQIVAKGHHFPLLTLACVVDGDLGLSGGDLRAAERIFQMIWQVAGRAGRAARPGRALIQTHLPDEPVMRALVTGDRDGFLAAEAEARREAWMPPFSRLVALIVAGPDGGEVERAAQDLARRAPREPGLRVLGPAPAPLALLRGRHRRRLLVQASREVPVQERVAAWLAEADLPRSVRVTVDVDPYSFL